MLDFRGVVLLRLCVLSCHVKSLSVSDEQLEDICDDRRRSTFTRRQHYIFLFVFFKRFFSQFLSLSLDLPGSDLQTVLLGNKSYCKRLFQDDDDDVLNEINMI